MAKEHTLYTWDPVSAAWVHERGPKVPPPPPPPDVHALQSYFLDEESKEWIRTVLAPMGRELAARWEGAHKIPDDAAGRPAKNGNGKPRAKSAQQTGGSPTLVVVVVVVLLVALGGVAVLASQTGVFAGANAAPTDAPVVVVPSVAPSTAPAPVESASPTAVVPGGGGGGGGGGGPVRTPAPPVATQTLPPGLSTRLPDGTAVIYTGPTLVVKPQALAATLSFTLANGRPAVGSVTVAIGTVSAPGLIDGNGRVAVTLATTALTPGPYSLQVIYNGTLATVTQITVR